MGLAPSKDPPKNQELRSSLEKIVIWDVKVRKVEVVSGVNGVAMDRHGLILWENEATGSRKVFRYLLDLRDAIFLSKMQSEIPKSRVFRIFTYSRYTASAADIMKLIKMLLQTLGLPQDFPWNPMKSQGFQAW